MSVDISFRGPAIDDDLDGSGAAAGHVHGVRREAFGAAVGLAGRDNSYTGREGRRQQADLHFAEHSSHVRLLIRFFSLWHSHEVRANTSPPIRPLTARPKQLGACVSSTKFVFANGARSS
jgi:hypothetical protein